MRKKDFVKKAGDLEAQLNGRRLNVETKAFSTDSVGWFFQGKVKVTLPDGNVVTCQGQISLQIVGSKELAPDAHLPGTEDATNHDEPKNESTKPGTNGHAALVAGS